MDREVVQVSAGHLESLIRHEMELFLVSLRPDQDIFGRKVPINLEMHIKEYRQYLDPEVVKELHQSAMFALRRLGPEDDYLVKTWVKIVDYLAEEIDRVRHEIPRDP
jgi:hypothetical protein